MKTLSYSSRNTVRMSFIGLMGLVFACQVLPLMADEVDVDAVMRAGNMVQTVEGHQTTAEDDATAALGPPATDNEKWFISVITLKGCEPCNRLKSAWLADPNLLALANPADQAASWSHFRYYDVEDETQAWRWKGIRFAGYPTILVQPPRTGKYGKPETVVYQGLGTGKPEEIARSITQAIRRYVQKISGKPQARATGGGRIEQLPFDIPEPGQPPLPVNPYVQPTQIPPPETTPAPGGAISLTTLVLGMVSSAFFSAALVPLITWALRTWREYRAAQKQPQILNDDQFQKLLDALKSVIPKKE